MNFLGWVALAGALLLLLALTSAWLRRLPITTAVVYLAIGVLLGPAGLDQLWLDTVTHSEWLERSTELAVVLSLFIGGLKLRLPLRHPAWRAALWLAGPVMVTCIAAVGAVAHLLLGVEPWMALLLGAVLAPTDPVLASGIAVSEAADRDRLRYAVSGEAGLNDGTAFPFVVLALGWLEHGGAGPWLGGWALHRLVWAVPAALVLGFAMGKGVGLLAIRLRSATRDTEAPTDLLALALVALTYVAAETIGAWGFLAVFAAGVGLRRAEMDVVRASPHPEHARAHSHPPAEDLVGARVDEADLEQPAVAAGVLVAETISFGDTAERLLEFLLVVGVGVAIGSHWDWRAVPLALGLAVARVLAVHLFLARSPTTGLQRWLVALFGIRGIGSLYYLGYALTHGVPVSNADALVALTIPVVALSILGHGITSTPALGWYERRLASSSPER